MLWYSSVGTALYTPSCPSVTAANMTSDDVVDIHRPLSHWSRDMLPASV